MMICVTGYLHIAVHCKNLTGSPNYEPVSKRNLDLRLSGIQIFYQRRDRFQPDKRSLQKMPVFPIDLKQFRNNSAQIRDLRVHTVFLPELV